MNLARMTRIDAVDPIGGLGPRVTPAPTPAPAPVRRADGIVQHPDGKLSTDFAPPAAPQVTPLRCHVCGLSWRGCMGGWQRDPPLSRRPSDRRPLGRKSDARAVRGLGSLSLLWGLT